MGAICFFPLVSNLAILIFVRHRSTSRPPQEIVRSDGRSRSSEIDEKMIPATTGPFVYVRFRMFSPPLP